MDRVKQLEEIARLAQRTRRAQKEYFRTRTAASLQESKDYEHRLDRAIDDLFTTPALFGNDQTDNIQTNG